MTPPKRSPRSKKPAPEKAAPPTPEAKPSDSVLVLVTRSDDGSVEAVPQIVGDVRLTEVESILKLALQNWRTRAGLRE